MSIEKLEYQILCKIEKKPETSQRELARRLGVSVGRVNYCMKALINKGIIKMTNFRNNENKLRYLYLLTPKGIEEKARITIHFLRQKKLEYDKMREEIAILQEEAANLDQQRYD